MPAATLRAVADHGVVRGDTIRAGFEAAWNTLDKLGRLGIDMADVAVTLEREGVATFVKSWEELIDLVTERLNNQGAQVNSAGSAGPVRQNESSPVPTASIPI
jgi:transaldolase